jgi:heme exporter protein C
MHFLANPTRFMKIVRWIETPIALIGGLLLSAGLYGGLMLAPADYLQGDVYRIIYVHVPAAWQALFIYVFMAVMSFCFLVWRHPLADILARAASPVGACFTAIALITGMLWGKPAWGTAWVWDARLTSVLVLFFLYLGHMILLYSFDDTERGSRAGAILALVGIINIPIIKFSVEWWSTLHQPASISRLSNPTISFDMAWPLLCMAGAFMALFALMLFQAARAEMACRKAQILMANRTLQ